MNLNECYSLLGLTRDASEADVKKAYKKLAMKYHPDKNSSPDAPEQFKKISEAYHRILNPNEEFGDVNIDINSLFNSIFSEGLGGLGGLSEMHEMGGMGGMDNILKNMFGNINENRNRNYNKGKDILKLVNISLEDIYNGNTFILTYDTQIINPECQQCNNCNGRGKIQVMQQLGPMVMQSLEYCSECNGQGHLNIYLPYTDTVEINIPKGYDYNDKMVIENKGLPQLKGINGDLIISFNLNKHLSYKLKNKDLYVHLDITFKESLLGFIKGITQLDNRLLTISSEDIIKPNTIRCIENEGIYDINTGQYGNLFLKFRVIYPNSLSKEQKDIIDSHF